MTTTAPPSRPTAPARAPAPPTTAPPAGQPLLRHLVGRILRERRTDADRTLREVAADARVSVAYLSEVERGRKEASSEVLVAICGALGMSLADLLAEAHAQLVAPRRTHAPRVLRLTSRTAETSLRAASERAHAARGDVSARDVIALAA